MRLRRKAISAELVRESKDNPGYYRYNIVIQELDGSEKVVPSYGKDMQDAISRLVWTERSGSKLISIAIVFIISTPLLTFTMLSAVKDDPIWLLFGLGSSILLGFLLQSVDRYISKKWWIVT